jgi:hypothetical protein
MFPCSSMLNRGLPALSRWRSAVLLDAGFFGAPLPELEDVAFVVGDFALEEAATEVGATGLAVSTACTDPPVVAAAVVSGVPDLFDDVHATAKTTTRALSVAPSTLILTVGTALSRDWFRC